MLQTCNFFVQIFVIKEVFTVVKNNAEVFFGYL